MKREFGERKCWGTCGGKFKMTTGNQLFCAACRANMKSSDYVPAVNARKRQGWIKTGADRT